MRRAIFCAFLYGLTSAAVGADVTTRLAETTEVLLDVRLSGDSQQCGISDAIVRAPFIFQTSKSAIQVKLFTPEDHSQSPYFEIGVLTKALDGLCFSAIYFQLKEQSIYPDTTQSSNVVRVNDLLWDDLRTIVTSLPEHAGQTNNTVQTLATDFVSSWEMSKKYPR